MGFSAIHDKYSAMDLDGLFQRTVPGDIERILTKGSLGKEDLIALLAPYAGEHLESMARKAHDMTLRYFGRTIQLYTPLYLSNYCVNRCTYCGFNAGNDTVRKKLTLEEVRREGEYISGTGLNHVLILTGESREKSPVSYIKDCVTVLKEKFSSISIETYALTKNEYKELIEAGVDGVTLYQEVYNKDIYDRVHLSGPKKDHAFRLEAPERALSAGMRTAGVGALLGLADWRKEVFFLALHAGYLQDEFSDAEINVSVPRIRPYLGTFKETCEVSDKDLVQMILALRLFLPRVGITLSTRESAGLREHLLPLGITRMSAGSTTAVGGHTIEYEECRDEQFEISDQRGVEEIKAMLRAKNYQPVLKDWLGI
ncbi:MAG: 2-iminoacetate synthase ThiH [Candidatus Omnitrophota bacterium]|nr:2-iminoacetate synthase ThiH [Candidatus Omnitrophota bacterium]